MKIEHIPNSRIAERKKSGPHVTKEEIHTLVVKGGMSK